jgi:hypothetical protein
MFLALRTDHTNVSELDTKKRTSNRSAREVEYDQKKYISVRVAARLAGLSHTTMYQWAQRGEASNGRHLDVIKDTLTNQILISEQSIITLLENRFHPLFSPSDDGQSPK